MNNSLVMSTFIKQLDECLDDISSVYSDDSRFLRCKLYLDTIKKTNPRLILVTWKTMIADKYEEQINAGNINYFLEKDYSTEIATYNPTIDNAIQDLRIAIKGMTPENQATSIKYIQNLCKLSKLYI